MFALQPLVLLLFGVDTNSDIAEDRLRTRGRHDGVLARFLSNRIAQVVEFVMLVVIDNLLVGEGSLTLRIPVDHTQAAVDEAFLIQVAEHLDDRFGAGLVHGERCSVPIAGATEFAQLLEDDTSVLVRPIPRMLEELLAREVGFVDSLLLEALDDLRFRSNRRMVGARNPAGVLALQACTANEDILNRLV